MKEKISTIIMSVIMVLIIIVFILVGKILWNEFEEINKTSEVKGIITEIDETEKTVDKNIQESTIIENPLYNIKDDQNTNNNTNSNTNANIKYTSESVEKYFYNQLENESQIIYKALESNRENMKSGTYKIELGNTFSSLLKTEGGQEKLGKYYQSAIEAYLYDNPEIFYLSPKKMYLRIEKTTQGTKVTYNVYIDNGKEENYFDDGYISQNQVETAIARIEQQVDNILSNRSGNAESDIKMVHDYIINNVEYETTISKDNIYNIYGALINGNAVCEGYARSFKYLMDKLGIPCTMVIGQGTNSEGETENHAWNYVQLNGHWYAIDCTWDDPVSTTGYVSNKSKYKYYLKEISEMSVDHTPNGQFTEGGKIFSYPSN